MYEFHKHKGKRIYQIYFLSTSMGRVTIVTACGHTNLHQFLLYALNALKRPIIALRSCWSTAAPQSTALFLKSISFPSSVTTTTVPPPLFLGSASWLLGNGGTTGSSLVFKLGAPEGDPGIPNSIVLNKSWYPTPKNLDSLLARRRRAAKSASGPLVRDGIGGGGSFRSLATPSMRSLDFARRNEPDLVRPDVEVGECSGGVTARLTSECDEARDTPSSGEGLILGEPRPLLELAFDLVDAPRLSEFSIVALSCGSTVPS